MSNPVSLIPAFASLFVALLTVYLLTRKFGAPSKAGRFVAIDGLRGYLGFFVFLHHSCIWYFFLKTGEWAGPPSHIYNNFGQSSVAFFFMITGFLFFGKLLNERKNGIDWVKLFVSRILRLSPMYFFVLTLIILIVAIRSDFTLNVAPVQLIKDIGKWCIFTILETPPPLINGYEYTRIIVAGVTWSLPYEWLFYLTLPILALVVGSVSSVPFLIVGLVGVAGFATEYSNQWHLLSFVGGIAAALLVRNEWFCKLASRRVASLLLLALISFTVAFFPSTYAGFPLFLLSLAFALIAGGNTMFGAFSSQVSRTLGEMAYSVYLLHGVILFVCFKFLFGFDKAALLSPSKYWLLITLMTPVLVSACFFTFRFIERPAMQRTGAVTNWLRTAMRRKNIPASAGQNS